MASVEKYSFLLAFAGTNGGPLITVLDARGYNNCECAPPCPKPRTPILADFAGAQLEQVAL